MDTRHVAATMWVAGLLTAGVGGVGAAGAQTTVRLGPLEEYLMEEAEEIGLARSAGPADVAADATVLVLDRSGEYRAAVDGSNGWTCFVGRAWTGPAPVVNGRRVLRAQHVDPWARGPQCFNAAASESVLAWHRLTTRLFFQGMDARQVDAEVERALASGALKEPRVGAMSFMLSPSSRLGRSIGRWMPHYMFYTPRITGPEYYGVDGITPSRPFVTDGGTPWATTTVVAPAWSDGTPATHGG